jgi:hypothetical protein
MGMKTPTLLETGKAWARIKIGIMSPEISKIFAISGGSISLIQISLTSFQFATHCVANS